MEISGYGHPTYLWMDYPFIRDATCITLNDFNLRQALYPLPPSFPKISPYTHLIKPPLPRNRDKNYV